MNSFDLSVETLGNLQIFRDRHVIANQSGREVKLRRREFQLFNFLFNNINSVVHKCALLELVWDFADFSASNTLEVHLSTLRRKLKALTDRVIIETVRGVGYRLVAG